MKLGRVLVAAMVVTAGLATPPSRADAPTDLTHLVNPLSGTLGAGFPTVGAGYPFGMTSPGPATVLPNGDDPVNYVGYGYQDPNIRGFALTHFNGAGIHIAGELPFMPTTGTVGSSDPTNFSSPFSHAQEAATPGYYSVELAKYRIGVELTSTPRTAVERLSFPNAQQGNVLLDVGRNNEGVQAGAIRVLDAKTVAGSVYVPNSGGFTIWFTARFDHPMTAHGTWLGSTLTPGSGAAQGRGVGGWVSFAASQVEVRVGLSYVSAAEATKNLDLEAPASKPFEQLRKAANIEWNRRLHSILVTGGDQQTFYTNLYRSMIMPSISDDADGSYRGFDSRIHSQPKDHHHYTGLSLWDTYRAQTPLLCLDAKDVAYDIGISLLDDADQNQTVIPKWVQGNRDYSIELGDPGSATLASLVGNDILTGAAARRAYAAVLHQATAAPHGGPRDKLADDLKYGYVPYEESSASLTLEYAVADAGIASMAARYGTAAQVAALRRRAGFWHNLLSPSDHFLRPRNRDGSWATPTNLGATKVWNPVFPDDWVEGTGWQYLWLVPQDLPGLSRAIGGQVATRNRLDTFFSTALQSNLVPVTPTAQTDITVFGIVYYGNQFTPGNEPDLQAPWVYNSVGEPWKTQKVLHAVSKVWSSGVTGLPGNDDTGTMSAWYVLASLGLYQPQPGQRFWDIAGPSFTSVSLPGQLTIAAPGSSPLTQYVASASLDGHALHRSWLPNADITGGRTLRFDLTPSEGSTWGSAPSDAPPTVVG